MIDQLDLIEQLFVNASILRDVAGRCDGSKLHVSAERLRFVADICERDGIELAHECNDGIDNERREAAEYAAIAARRERIRQEDDEELSRILEREVSP